ncbi:site-specific DNA-methyltransferase [Candidatus Bathyarchaeota archaeon]|nr:site-specific DNA-methyltransferase [Candidatus Bathyarchaeota archaeon]
MQGPCKRWIYMEDDQNHGVSQVSGEIMKKLKKLIPFAFMDGFFNVSKLLEEMFPGLEIKGERGAHCTPGVIMYPSSASIQGDTYMLGWFGRQDAIKTLHAPPMGALHPSLSRSIHFDSARNIFIEGDNLEVLKLLQDAYLGLIKLIFIDPPYNTGKNFIYADNFRDPLGVYLEQTGQVDEGGKTTTRIDTEGRLHSTWLSMMYPRLMLSRFLLRDDGLIFITIDDNEIHNLRRLMDEIYGEENFMGTVIWNSTKSVTNTALISVSHTYIVIYAKQKSHFTMHREDFRLDAITEGFSNPDDDPRGPWKGDPFQVGGERPNQMYTITNPATGEEFTPLPGNSWKNDFETFKKLVKDNRIVFGKTGTGAPQRKRFLYEAMERGSVPKTLWDDIETTSQATIALKGLMGAKVFTNPKPVSLLKRIIKLGMPRNEGIILDFFAGSGTTAEAVLAMNEEDGGSREFILVQVPEPVNPKSIASSVGFKNIAQVAHARLTRVIDRLTRVHEDEDDNSVQVKAVTHAAKKNDCQNSISNALSREGFRYFTLDTPDILAIPFTHASNGIDDNAGAGVQGGKDGSKAIEDWILNPLSAKATDLSILFEITLKEGFPLSCRCELLTIGKNGFYNVTRQNVNRDGEKEKNDVSGIPHDRSLLVCLDGLIHDDTITALITHHQDRRVYMKDGSLSDGQKLTLANVLDLEVI